MKASKEVTSSFSDDENEFSSSEHSCHSSLQSRKRPGRLRKRKPRVDSGANFTISDVYSNQELTQGNFQLRFGPKSLHVPKNLPYQDWDFHDFLPEMPSGQATLDLYINKRDKTHVRDFAASAEGSHALSRVLGVPMKTTGDQQAQLPGIEVGPDFDSSLDQLYSEATWRATANKQFYKNRQAQELECQIVELRFGERLKVAQVAKKAGVSNCTVSKVCSHFIKFGEIPSLRKKVETVSMPNLSEIAKFLTNRYHETGYIALSFNQAVDELRFRYPQLRELSSKQLVNVLKRSFSLKKVCFKTKPSLSLLVDYHEEKLGTAHLLASMILQGITLLYIDETSVLEGSFAQKAVGNRFLQPTKNKRANVLGVHIVLMVSQDKIETFQASKRAFTAAQFEHFVGQSLEIMRLEDPSRLKKACLIVDNSPIHRNKEMLKRLEKKGIRILFTLPSTPEVNAAEQVFRDLKKSLSQQIFLKGERLMEELSRAATTCALSPGLAFVRTSLKETADP